MKTPLFDSALLPDEREFDRMKNSLLEQIGEAERPSTPHLVPDLVPHLVPPGARLKKPRRYRAVWVTAMGLAAAALTVVLVSTNVFEPGAATAEAAEVLRNAASITASDPVVGPGQFLKVETKYVGVVGGRSPSGKDGAYEQPQTTTLYIPPDRAGMWVMGRQWLKPGRSYGDGQAMINDFWRNPHQGDLQLYQLPGGGYWEDGPSSPSAKIAKLPRDSATLYTYLYDHAEGDQSKDEAVFTNIVDLLRIGLVPAELRSAMYEVLARVPGVYLADGKANLNGRVGLAISRKEPSLPSSEQIIIDPATGLFIGERSITTDGSHLLPVGTNQGWSAVTTTVVDQAPAGPYDILRAP